MDFEDRQFDENEWTPDELAQLRALDSERAPGIALKARTTRALRNEHLVGRRWQASPRMLLALAAASVVFAAGAVVGYAAGSQRAASRETSTTPTTAVARADSAVVAQRPVRQVIWF